MRFDSRAVSAGVALSALVSVFCTAASPAPSAAETQDQIDTIQKAADELRETDPSLAEQLQEMADKKREKLAKS